MVVMKRRAVAMTMMLFTASALPKPEVRDRAELPAREYVLPTAPSAMVQGPLTQWKSLVGNLERDTLSDLETFDIVDPILLRERYLWLALMAQWRADSGSVRAWQGRARRLQDTPPSKWVSGVLNELIVEDLTAPRRARAKTLRDAVRARFGAMPIDVVGPTLRSFRDQLQSMTEGALLETYKKKVDPQVVFSGNKVTASLAMQILGGALQRAHALPRKRDLVDGLTDVIEGRVGR